MKENERKWKKMKENESVNRVPFQNVHYSLGKKVSRPEEHPRGDREDKFSGEER